FLTSATNLGLAPQALFSRLLRRLILSALFCGDLLSGKRHRGSLNLTFVFIASTIGDLGMRDVKIYRGALSRANMILSLVLVVFSFASCSGQKLMSLTGSQPAQPAPVASVAGIQTSYADLVSRVSP